MHRNEYVEHVFWDKLTKEERERLIKRMVNVRNAIRALWNQSKNDVINLDHGETVLTLVRIEEHLTEQLRRTGEPWFQPGSVLDKIAEQKRSRKAGRKKGNSRGK